MSYACFSFAVEMAAAIQSSTKPATVSTIDLNTSALSYGGNKVLLPDIIITENYAGGLKPNAFVTIGSDFDQVILFDISEAKLKAYRLSDKADITSEIIGNNTLIADPAPSKTNIADVAFKLKAGSSAETGPIKIIISHLIVTLSDLTDGELVIYQGKTLKIGGSDTSGAELDTLDKIDSNLGSGTTAQTLTLKGGVGCPQIAEVCGSGYKDVVVSGPKTARTIKARWVPSWSIAGSQGRVFVFALLPLTLGGKIYVMSNDSTWTICTSCETAPAFYSGALNTMTDIPIVPTPTDLTGLLGTQIYLGGGLAEPDASPDAACRHMLNYGEYSLIYTIF